MAKVVSRFDITSFDNSWGENPVDGKPQSGQQVREFLGRKHKELAQSTSIATAWTPSTSYVVGKAVTYNGVRYKCTTAHTSGTTFDASKWTVKSVEDSLALATPTEPGVVKVQSKGSTAAKGVVIDSDGVLDLGIVHDTDVDEQMVTVQTITGDGTVLTALSYDINAATEHLAGVMSAEQYNQLNSTIGSSSIADNWEKSIDYASGAVVTYKGTRYRCIEAHNSGTTFDNTKWSKESVQKELQNVIYFDDLEGEEENLLCKS